MPTRPVLETLASSAAALGEFWMSHFRHPATQPFDQRSQEMFERFADQMQCMIYRCDVAPSGKTHVTYTNAAVEWIYELSVEQATRDATFILRLVHPEDYDRVWAALVESHKTGNPWHEQYRVILPQKGCCWREARATVERLPNGSSVWHGFIWDITDLKTSEEARKRFFAMMGHELRTPISGVIGYVELLSDTPLDENQRDLLNMVAQSGEHLLSLVNDFMDHSKLDAGKMILRNHAFSIHEVFESACAMVNPRAAEKNLDIIRSYDGITMDSFDGDALRLTQILTNLLGNAIKHGAKKIVRISGSTHEMPGHSGIFKVSICVDDDGSGIQEKHRSGIFDPYVQLGDGAAGSTGLGLPISRQLARQMGGDITVGESDLGGASFRVTLMLPSTVEAKENR